MNRPIKVLFYADTFSGTSGYSRVGRELALRLATDERFEVIFQQIADNTPTKSIGNVLILPTFFSRESKEYIAFIAHHINFIGPQVFIPISDTFILERDGINKIQFGNIKYIPYIMIDAYNLPDDADKILKQSNHIITGSKHGQDTLKANGYNNSSVLFHGVNCNLFKPVKKNIQNEYKKQLGCPEDHKLFLHVGRNFPRKRLPRMIEAFARYKKENPDEKIMLYLHSSDHKMKAWDMDKFRNRMAKQYNIDISFIKFSKEHKLGCGKSEKDFIKLYQACDFYVTTASGEGFGFPVVEAMACNKLVIASDNTTHSVFLADNRGILVSNADKAYVGHGCYQPLVDIDKYKEAIGKAMKLSQKDYNDMTNKALQYVKENCNWDTITEELKTIILNEVKIVNDQK